MEVTFVDREGAEHTVQAPIGNSLMEVAHAHDIELEGACEGSLACSTCHVIVVRGATPSPPPPPPPPHCPTSHRLPPPPFPSTLHGWEAGEARALTAPPAPPPFRAARRKVKTSSSGFRKRARTRRTCSTSLSASRRPPGWGARSSPLRTLTASGLPCRRRLGTWPWTASSRSPTEAVSPAERSHIIIQYYLMMWKLQGNGKPGRFPLCKLILPRRQGRGRGGTRAR